MPYPEEEEVLDELTEEEEAPEEVEPDDEEQEDDDYELQFETINGVVTLKATQLADMVEGYESLQNAGEELTKTKEALARYEDFYGVLAKDEIVQHVIEYRKQGFTDAQIKKGLGLLAEQEMPEPTTVEEQIVQLVKQATEPLERQINTIMQERQSTSIEAENDKMLLTVAQQRGIPEELLRNQDFKNEMYVAHKEYNDSADPRRVRLTAGQARLVLDYAKAQYPGTKTKTVKAEVQRPKVPRMMPGNSGTARAPQPVPQQNLQGLSQTQRMRIIDDL